MNDPLALPRPINVKLYIGAFIIAAIIFTSGIWVGKLLEADSLNNLSANVEQANAKVNSIEMLYLLGEDPALCPVYSKELNNLDAQVEQVGYKITYLEEAKHVSDPELKRNYFLLEANAYLLSQRVKDKCDANFSTIVYFYANNNCSDCRQQGYELLDLKKRLGPHLRVYSFDGELQSEIADALKLRYGVKSYPAIILDGNQTFTGLKTAKWIETSGNLSILKNTSG